MPAHVALALMVFQGCDGENFDEKELRITQQWLRSKANSIERGSSEIQLNGISKRILDLPEQALLPGLKAATLLGPY